MLIRICDFKGRCDWKKVMGNKFSKCVSICLCPEECEHILKIGVKREMKNTV